MHGIRLWNMWMRASMSGETHSSLFWIGMGIMIALGFFTVFYILPRLLAHFFPGFGF